jgi:hypothetical protein
MQVPATKLVFTPSPGLVNVPSVDNTVHNITSLPVPKDFAISKQWKLSYS